MSTLRVEGVLFDLDGVLLDSHDAVVRHWHDFAGWHGLDGEQLDEQGRGRRSIETIRAALPEASEEEIQTTAARFFELEETDVDGVKAVPGAQALLEALPSHQWTIVTSCGRKLASARMRAAGITCPDSFVTADDVQRGKPDPSGYLMGARQIGVDPTKCVVFEDALSGLEAAARAGAHRIGVATAMSVRALRELTSGDCPVVSDLSRVNAQVSGREIALSLEEQEGD